MQIALRYGTQRPSMLFYTIIVFQLWLSSPPCCRRDRTVAARQRKHPGQKNSRFSAQELDLVDAHGDRVFSSTSILVDLVDGDLASQAFQRGLDLLRIVLGDALLQHLRSALHELLRINQRQPQHTLDFLDDLGLRGGVEGLKLDGE